ncbi:HalX domain-containing protein [Natrinema caseinilyticum]|uniref:HalX domain-containing protein n=1 Tax=Natrinema caseinilyticum TaxID=2961570 RepID=UPI0020C2EBFB|nr:HalX domain-containing protein [Natrinema caseinilyticum]
MSGDTNAVLVADSDPEVVARFRSWLADDFRVETTTDGDDALAILEDVDATLVARDLQTASGTAVASEIERNAAHTMAVLRYTEPGTERYRFTGDSLVKPVSKTALFETVDHLLRRARYDNLVAECASLAVECGAFEARTDPGCELEADDEYADIQRRLADLFTELDELVRTFDRDDFRAAFTTCGFGGNTPSQQAERLS